MIDVKKFTMAVVSLAVGVLLVLTVLVPVINDSVGSGSGDVLYTNTGDFQYKTIKSDSEEHTFVATLDDSTVTITTDGVVSYQSSVEDLVPVPIIYGNNFVIFVCKEGANVVCYLNKNIFADDGGGTYLTDITPSVTYTTRGHLTYDETDNVVPEMYDEITAEIVNTIGYLVADNGDVVFSDDPVVADDSFIVGLYYVTVLCADIGTWGYGTIDDLQVSPLHEGVVGLDLTTTETDEGLTKIDHMVVSWDEDDPYYEVDYFFVPIQIGSDSGGMSPTLASMLSVIPLVVIVGLLMGAITMFVKKD